LAWEINFEANALSELSKLDPPIAKRIVKFLRERVAKLDDPRTIGESLRGTRLGNFWRYRVGDFRIICDIQDPEIRILILRIGHRREVYKR
jgi:mRNA interferase RelE/StbE